jgi:hypothetical protein
LLLAAIAIVTAACDRSGSGALDSATTVADTSASSAKSATCGADVRSIVVELASRMRRVSVLAADSILERSLADAYGSVVTATLLDAWQRDPRSAPGREVSNPWPARIDIHTIDPDGATCRVDGDVVYVTTADTTRAVERRPVTLSVETQPKVLVSDFRWAQTPDAPPRAPAGDSTVPRIGDGAAVVRQYYHDIQNRDFTAAYARWSDGGRASGKSRDAFAAGFANTASVEATVADSGSIEGAAGSQFVTVPVRVTATLRDGTQQRFAGTYTLRRAMVDGATPEQRRWHIFKADLHDQP